MTTFPRPRWAPALALGLVAALPVLAGANPPPPSANVPWYPVPLLGGPLAAIATANGATGQQLLVAGGEEVFTSRRAEAWRAATPRVGRVGNLIAVESGVIFATNADSGTGFRSNDAGKAWNEVRLRGSEPVRFLAASPRFKDDGLVYGITRNDWRLYRNDKGTVNWIEVVYTTGVPHQTGGVAISPLIGLDETIFSGTDQGVYKSTDKGQTWSLMGTPASGAPAFGAGGGTPDRQGLVLPWEYGDDPSRPGDPVLRTVFAYNAEGVFRSDDDGATWRRLALDGVEVRGLAVSNGFPTDPVLMAAVSGSGGQVAAVSSDAGASWRFITGPDGVAGTGVAMALDFAAVIPAPDPRRRFFYYLPLALKNGLIPPPGPPAPPWPGSREAYLATDGDGAWKTTDAGATWTREWAGLANVQPLAVAFLPGGGDANALVGTRAAGLYRSLDGGRSYRPQAATGLPRGNGQDLRDLTVSPGFDTDHTVFLAATSGLWTSTDGGRAWRRLANAPAPASAVMLSPSFGTDHTLTVDGTISRDGGASFQPLNGPEGPVAFSPSYATDHTLWGGGHMLRRSTDDGMTWTNFNNIAILRDRPVYAVATAQVIVGEFRIFVGTDRGLMQSFDNGQTWSSPNVTTRPIRDIAVQVTQQPQGALVAAASDDGVFWSDTRGVQWNKMPVSAKPSGAVSSASDASTLLASTPLRVSRYGLGSARVWLPAAYR
jgi:photosystem II stability/assembly factor-like uncharacterized protein